MRTTAPANVAEQGFRWKARHWVPAGASVFAVIIAIKWPVLTLPASFDASWALYPAASHLAEGGFDYVSLLSEPTGADLGPNTNHTLSLTVLLTAVAIRLFGDGALFAMHTVMLLIAVAAVMGAYRFFRFTQSPWRAGVLAGLTGLVPVASAQMGLIYVDVPVWAATIWAAAFVIERNRLPQASMMAILAAASKASGVITALALGIFVLARSRNWLRAAMVALPGTALATIHLLAGSANRAAPVASSVLEQWDRGLASLLAMPAIVALAILAVGALVLRPNPVDRSDVLAWVFAGTFVATYLAGPLIGFDIPLLSRHWIQVIPFLLYSAWRVMERYAPAIRLGFLGALLVWSIGSANGRWHPAADLNNEIFQERTTAVYEVIELRRTAIAAAAAHDLPTISSLNTWFRVSYPNAGFTESRLTNWRPASHLEKSASVAASLPDRFVVVVDSPGAYSTDEGRLVAELDGTGRFDVDVEVVSVGRFSSEVRVYSRP